MNHDLFSLKRESIQDIIKDFKKEENYTLKLSNALVKSTNSLQLVISSPLSSQKLIPGISDKFAIFGLLRIVYIFGINRILIFPRSWHFN